MSEILTILLTGQDADWHYIFHPGSANFDGPAGFLIDAINWAGSGTGMGGVFLGANPETATIFTTSGSSSGSTNNVVIPGPVATFPINKDLTSGGLSNWSTSSHRTFVGFDTSKWEPINIDGDNGDAVTIVSKATAGGGTSGGGDRVPDAGSTLGLLGIALISMVGFARRRSV